MDLRTIEFYPAHPSADKTYQLETRDSPLLEQRGPVTSAELYDSFCHDFDRALQTYEDKRFEVTGIAIQVGPDGHHKPSVQLSDSIGGRCHVLCVFPSEEVYG